MSGLLALALGVLGCHRGQLSRTGKVRDGGCVTAGEDVRILWHGHVFVDRQPPFLGRRVELFDQWVWPNPYAPHQGPGGYELAIGQLDADCGRFGDRRFDPEIDAAVTQHPNGGPRESYVETGQYPVGDVDQEPPHRLVTEPTASLCRLVGGRMPVSVGISGGARLGG